MRIAILGSVALPVPPPLQGGTEWIAYFQAKGLGERGHSVTLFAAKGSKKDPSYTLVEVGLNSPSTSPSPSPTRRGDLGVSSSLDKRGDLGTLSSFDGRGDLGRGNGGDGGDKGTNIQHLTFNIQKYTESSRMLRKENAYLSFVMQELINRKDTYDVILNNMRGEAVFLPLARLLGKPFINVMHVPIFPELASVFQQFQTRVITISNAQRKDFPDLNYLATVYNCVDSDKYAFSPFASDYLLMMGTIGRHKNQSAAIEVAKKLGKKLVLAGKVRDKDYFEELQKDIDGEMIRWYGELDFEERLHLYQQAKAFLFPILWEEPFGLVMIEAMSCGTPVIAFGNGAIPEVVRDGLTGFVVESEASSVERRASSNEKYVIQKSGAEGLVEAVQRISALPEDAYRQMRENCRTHVEEHFTVEKMLDGYEGAIKKVVSSK